MGQDLERKLSPFGLAALALDQELAAFERFTERLLRIELDSRKHLEQAASTAGEATASRQRIGQHMGDLVTSLQEVRSRNEGLSEQLELRMAEIEARMQDARRLAERATQLGVLAGEISEAAQRVGAAAREGGAATAAADLGAILERLDGLIQDGRALEVEARERKLPELSTEIEALRQQLQGARNRVHLATMRLQTGHS